jgi:hypothetical protein
MDFITAIYCKGFELLIISDPERPEGKTQECTGKSC